MKLDILVTSGPGSIVPATTFVVTERCSEFEMCRGVYSLAIKAYRHAES